MFTYAFALMVIATIGRLIYCKKRKKKFMLNERKTSLYIAGFIIDTLIMIFLYVVFSNPEKKEYNELILESSSVETSLTSLEVQMQEVPSTYQMLEEYYDLRQQYENTHKRIEEIEGLFESRDRLKWLVLPYPFIK